MADAQAALFRELASFSGGAFQHVEERTQACASGDVPKLFDLPEEVARIGDALERPRRCRRELSPLG
jgi:hypothetical protein